MLGIALKHCCFRPFTLARVSVRKAFDSGGVAPDTQWAWANRSRSFTCIFETRTTNLVPSPDIELQELILHHHVAGHYFPNLPFHLLHHIGERSSRSCISTSCSRRRAVSLVRTRSFTVFRTVSRCFLSHRSRLSMGIGAPVQAHESFDPAHQAPIWH